MGHGARVDEINDAGTGILHSLLHEAMHDERFHQVIELFFKPFLVNKRLVNVGGNINILNRSQQTVLDVINRELENDFLRLASAQERIDSKDKNKPHKEIEELYDKVFRRYPQGSIVFTRLKLFKLLRRCGAKISRELNLGFNLEKLTPPVFPTDNQIIQSYQEAAISYPVPFVLDSDQERRLNENYFFSDGSRCAKRDFRIDYFNEETKEFFTSYGFDPEQSIHSYVQEGDYAGYSVLHIAVFTDNVDLINFLLGLSVNINAQSMIDDEFPFTPLDMAISLNNEPMKKILQDRGALTSEELYNKRQYRWILWQRASLPAKVRLELTEADINAFESF